MTLQLDTIKTKRIIKSLGFSEKFEMGKLEHAIDTALDFKNTELKTAIMKEVIDKIKDKGTISTSYINDIIESYLMKKNKIDILQKYMAIRLEKNKELADKYNYFGDRLTSSPHFRKQELKDFSTNQVKIAAGRYLLKDMETGETIESMSDWFYRVASHIVLGSVVYDAAIYSKEEIGSHIQHKTVKGELSLMKLSDSQIQVLRRLYKQMRYHMPYDEPSFLLLVDDLLQSEKYQELEKKYFNYMYKGIFEPNTPTLMNAGTENGKCSACFSLEVYDTMISIGNIWPSAALIYQGAGGLGVNVSYVRPAGSNVGSTFGAATGPIPLVLEMIDAVTDKVKSGGKRRGANMGIMEYWHPDISRFITMKKTPGYLENFNVSVMFDNKFWDYYYNNTDYPLQFNDKVHGMMSAKSLFEDIAVSAWNSAEPGVLFKDNANLANPLKNIREEIHITNPCVSGRTRLNTEFGMLTAEELYNYGKPVMVATDTVTAESNMKRRGKSGRRMQLEFKEASKIFKTSDDAQVYLLETSDGYHLECTDYHPIVMKDGSRKELRNIKVGEQIAIQSNTGYFGDQGTAAIGALLGFAQNQFEILEERMYTSPDLDICLYEIIDEFKRKYGDILYYDTSKKELLFPIDYDTKDALLSFIKDRVPDIIWRGTKECIQAYIRMIFDTDPTCKFEFNRLEYSNKNVQFLRDLQMLLLNFGVKTSIRSDDYITWKLIIPDTSFAHYIFSRIGFRSSSKISKILYNTKNAGRVEYYSTVIGITKLKDPQPVYDATEFSTHTLIFNGLVTGNCSEQYLYDGESCTLGSINLAKLVKNGKFDWAKYTEIIHDTTRFLNDVLEINVYPTEHIKEESNKTRRIGLGIMGLADLLYLLKIPYNSKEAYDFMTELSKVLYITSVKASINLAEERGPCHWYKELIENGFDPIDAVKRVYEPAEQIAKELEPHFVNALKLYGVRNMWTTTVAPTGTISMIANCSNGLEPNYALAFKKTVLAGDFFFANEIFKKALIKEGIYSQELLAKVEQNYGSCQGIEEIPEHIQKVFVTAFDTHWLDHIVAQAVWQRWIDNSISKTINMPHNATVDDVKYAYIISHDLGLKGISLYRDGSRETQVLHTDTRVASSDGATNGVRTTLSNVTDKRVFPTEFALNYMSQFLKNKDLAAEIKERVMQGQQFYQAENNEICIKCNEGKMILEAGCNRCTSCGYSDRCTIG